MSSRAILMTAAVAALAVAVLAKPTHPKPYKVDLAKALNRTVCPIVVEVDEDPSRVPRRIKLLKCAPDPRTWCEHQKIPQHECCDHNHDGHNMGCVEMIDTVLVHYPAKGTTGIIKVEVGCSCLVQQTVNAALLPEGST